MKLIFLALFTIISLEAKNFYVSSIPLPSLHIINLSPLPCNDKCLENLLNQKMYFSLLAHTKSELESELELTTINFAELKQSSKLERLSSTPLPLDSIEVALLLPHNSIGKYTSTVTSATLSYLIYKNYPFRLKSFTIEGESSTEIAEALEQIKNDGFRYVIAPLTANGEIELAKVNTNLVIFIPTINKKTTSSKPKENIYYGGIDYELQSRKLLAHSSKKLALISDGSSISNRLGLMQESLLDSLHPSVMSRRFVLPPQSTKIDPFIKSNPFLNGSTLLLNTPIVKSSMVLSQLSYNDFESANVLSLQTNYTPHIFTMTQYKDRKQMLIANSIVQNSDNLVEINSLLDNDISYDWINYTTTVGIDFLAHLAYQEERTYNIEVKDNSMIYPVELLIPALEKFIPYKDEWN
ncbi:MAG: hypothetical protein WCR69_08590 [Sulfuricurvum sp.]